MASSINNTPDRKEVLRLGELAQTTGASLKKAIADSNYRDAVKYVNTLQRSLDSVRPPMRRLVGSSMRFQWEPSRLRGSARGIGWWFLAGLIIGGVVMYFITPYVMR